MNFEFSADDEQFRQEVRDYLQSRVPEELRRRVYIKYNPPLREDLRYMLGALAEKGWSAPGLPIEYGGTDWSPLRKHIFLEEMYRIDALESAWGGLHMLAPVLVAFGSEAQKARFLPPTLNGEIYWCQGFSEPNAGSDLARLRTRAVLDGDHYVVNGQKIWTSDASIADWGFFLVRTDPDVKPQAGISFLLIKMDTPGVTVRPIPTIDGSSAALNEVFLDDVRVPKDQLVGEAGKGWTYAKYLLEKERTASAFLYYNKRELAKLKDIARSEQIDGVALIETPEFAARIADVEADMHALEWSVLRVLANEDNKYNLNAVISALKLRGSSMQQRVTQLYMDAMGRRALRCFPDHQDIAADDPFWPHYVPGRANTYFEWRASTIYGGTQEVQKNIIAKLQFGL